MNSGLDESNQEKPSDSRQVVDSWPKWKKAAIASAFGFVVATTGVPVDQSPSGNSVQSLQTNKDRD